MSLYNSKAPSQSLENCSPKLAASDLSRAGEDDAGWQISGRSAKITVKRWHWVIQIRCSESWEIESPDRYFGLLCSCNPLLIVADWMTS
jgi:hypothetical protein